MSPTTPLQTESKQISIPLLKQQDQKSFELLYDSYSGALYNVIFKITNDEAAAQDILQDSFVKIWRNIATYDEQKASIFTWMMNICRNTAIDYLRSKNRKPNIQKQVEDVRDLAADNKATNLNTMGIREHISKLRLEYYEALNVVYMLGFSHTEAADELGIPLGTLKTRIRNGLIELRAIYMN